MAAANGSPSPHPQAVPPPPTYAPTNQQPRPPQRPPRNTKVNVNKVSVLPDMPSLPALSFSYSKTTVVNGGANGGGTVPGSGFTSDEDIQAYCEALRKEHRPRAVLRALDAETLYAVLSAIPDVNGSMAGSRARARRVTRPLRRIAAAEKLIGKMAAQMWALFTREFEAELAQISAARNKQKKRRPGAVWKQW